MQTLIGNISDELYDAISKTAGRRMFGENEQIFAEGEDAAYLPIVLNGKVKMLHSLDQGKEVIIRIFQAGEMFAVPPVFDGKKYPATATAMEETQLLLLRRNDFLDLLRQSSEFAFAVIGWMSEMLRDKTATIQNLATASPEHRIGTVLLKIAEDVGSTPPIRISLRREDIAKIAGLTTETTIRVIRRLAQKGVVNIEHGKIIIDDAAPLRRLVS